MPGEAVLRPVAPPLVAAVRPEQPLGVAGARQAGDGAAVEQAGAAGTGHLQHVVDGAGERAGLGTVAAAPGRGPAWAAARRMAATSPAKRGESAAASFGIGAAAAGLA